MNAVDFKIKQVDSKNRFTSDSTKFSNGTNKTNKLNIFDPTSNKVWSTDIFESDGEKLTLTPKTNDTNQFLNISIVADKTMVISLNNKCLNYDERENVFVSGKCKDQYKSSFDIYTDRSI